MSDKKNHIAPPDDKYATLIKGLKDYRLNLKAGHYQ
jgi:hypothetical protein